MSRPPTPKRKGTIWREADRNRTAIYEAETDGLHMLNATALAIWELCDGHTTTEEMASAISELTDIEMNRWATPSQSSADRGGRGYQHL